MSIRVTFLGTAAAVPTVERSLPAVLMQRGNEHFMFDCGEGMQRQMIRAKLGFHKPMKIFISHLHGDHVLGLPGLLQTMALLDRQKLVEVYGPVGLARFLKDMQETLQFGLTFDVAVHELSGNGLISNQEEYTVAATHSSHAITSYSYAFSEKSRPGRFHPEKAKGLGVPVGEAWGLLQHGKTITLPNGRIVKPEEVTGPIRKGRKVVYTGDTRPFSQFAEFAQSADLVIHECTFDDTLAEKAVEDWHSTPAEAAAQAKAANAKQLVLTHISARYADVSVLLEQAKKVFANTLVARDFLELELPLAE